MTTFLLLPPSEYSIRATENFFLNHCPPTQMECSILHASYTYIHKVLKTCFGSSLTEFRLTNTIFVIISTVN